MNIVKRMLPHEVRELLDRHLDAVDRALASSDVSRQERRAICDEVETQACEMLWQRTTEEPTVQDLQAVLAEMDDPESYGLSNDDRASRHTATDLARVCGLHWSAVVAALIPFLTVLAILLPSPIRPNREFETVMLISIMTVMSIMLSALAVGNIRRRPDRYRGVMWAAFGILGLPLLLLNCGAAALINEIDILGTRMAVEKQQQNAVLKQTLNDVKRESDKNPGMQKDIAETTARIEGEIHNRALTKLEKWLAENALVLNLLTIVVVCGTTMIASIGTFLWLSRRLRRFCDKGFVTAGR